jgi:acetaldehyde dehydrogenase (acetylating)
MIRFGGQGHSLVIHAGDENIILAFALKKPVFRILANTMGTLGSIGMTTGLMPAVTLGSGGVGGAISGDNITTTHLLNIKRLAFPIKQPPDEAMAGPAPPSAAGTPESAEMENIIRIVIEEVLRHGKGG